MGPSDAPASSSDGAAPTTASLDDVAPRAVRRSTAKGRRREQEIFDAAADIFDRKGYAAATLAEIGDAVGLLKGSLYYYIESKEDLLYHITRTIHDGTLANLETAEAAGTDPTDRLRTLLHGHVASFESRMTWIRVFYAEYSHLSRARRAEIQRVRRRYEEYVQGLIVEGQASGAFCPAIDARVIGNIMLTTVNGVFLWYRPGRDGTLAEIADAYTDFLLNGLRCPVDHAH